MPFVINSRGKASRKDPISNLVINAATAYFDTINDLLDMMSSFNKATGEALDRLSEVYGIERKDASQ